MGYVTNQQANGLTSFPTGLPIRTVVKTFYDMHAIGDYIQIEGFGPILRVSAIVQGGDLPAAQVWTDITFGSVGGGYFRLNLPENSEAPYSGLVVVEFLDVGTSFGLEPSDVAADH